MHEMVTCILLHQECGHARKSLGNNFAQKCLERWNAADGGTSANQSWSFTDDRKWICLIPDQSHWRSEFAGLVFQQDNSGQSYFPDPSSRSQAAKRVWGPDYNEAWGNTCKSGSSILSGIDGNVCKRTIHSHMTCTTGCTSLHCKFTPVSLHSICRQTDNSRISLNTPSTLPQHCSIHRTGN